MKLIALLVLAVGVAACGVDVGTTADTSPTTTTTTPSTSGPVARISARAELAIVDLATHLDVSSDQIALVSDEDVTWSDGSIGCPEPGMNYTQAMVPGYLVVLSVGDTTYQYHGALGQEPFRCARQALTPFDPGY